MAMTTSVCDEKGRILLPRSAREQFGRSFHIVKTKVDILLVPSSKDPLKELAELGRTSKLRDLPIPEIRASARRRAAREAAK